MNAAVAKACNVCGIPADAGFFDESTVQDAPRLGQELVLARYELHRNYCGVLLYFAQFTDRYANDSSQVHTPGYRWQIRCDGQPRDPYLTFDRIINPWGLSGFPIALRLETGCVVEFVVRRAGDDQDLLLTKIGGRILGRYWYNAAYGGTPNSI
jgi:hypothetical protein